MNAAAVLSEKQIAFYRENGYLQVDNVFTAQELDELEAITDETNSALEKDLPPLAQREAYQQVFLQVVNVWQRDPRFKKFTLHPRTAAMAQALIGCDRVRLWHDHLMTKMPGPGARATDWHQDTPYWPHAQSGGMSIWIPLQDVDLDNGCMHFVPRSHSWNMKEVIHLDQGEDLFSRLKGKSAEDVQRVYVPLKRGSVTFHDGLTFHYASRNQSDKPRKVLSVIYIADGTTFNGLDHPVTRTLTDLKPGAPLDGPLFPIIETKTN